MKVEHELKLNHTEMSMIRWTCGVKLNERKKNEELGEPAACIRTHYSPTKIHLI